MRLTFKLGFQGICWREFLCLDLSSVSAWFHVFSPIQRELPGRLHLSPSKVTGWVLQLSNLLLGSVLPS